MTEILKIEGLSAGYGPLRVIHDLDLVIHPGERVGIVGLNGHGKTTLFYAIAGLTGWQRGSIVLNGKQIGRTRSQGPGRYHHQIVPQDRKSTRLNSSHSSISYAVFCLKKQEKSKRENDSRPAGEHLAPNARAGHVV